MNFGSNTTVVGVLADVTTPITSTLNAGDSITGTGSNNTLRVVDTTGAAVANGLAGVTLAGVQTLSIQAVGTSLLGTTYALAGTTGVTNVTSLNSSNVVNFTGLAAGASITASGSATTALGLTATYAVATSTPTVNFAGGVTNFTVAVLGGTATSAVINSTGGTNGTTAAGVAAANTVNLGGGGQIAALTVNAATNLRTAVTFGDFAAAGAALTVSGAATSVDLGTTGVYKSINASGLTAGGVTVNASSQLTSFTGGTGNDSLTVNTLGLFGANTALIGATAIIDAGAGVDTVAGLLVNNGNAAAFKNFEVVSLGGVGPAQVFDGSLMANSVLTGVSYNAAIGGAPISVAGSSALIVSNLVENANGFNVAVSASAGVNTTLGFTTASVIGITDKVNYNFASLAAGAVNAGIISQANIELVNIVSGGVVGAANTLGLNDNALTTVTITGANAFTFSGMTNGAGNAAGQGAQGANLITQLTRIDGSAATGNLTITDTGSGNAAITKASVTILGGSGNDTITVVTSAAGTDVSAPSGFGADTVTTGAGVDRVVVTGATARSTTNTAAFSTITDLAAGDQIGFISVAASFNNTAVNVSAAVSLLDALNTALAANDGAKAVSYFVFGGNTYMVDNSTAATPTLQTTDIIVRLTGVVDLTNGSIDAATGVFTLA